MFLTFLQLKMVWHVSVLRPNVEKKNILEQMYTFHLLAFELLSQTLDIPVTLNLHKYAFQRDCKIFLCI